MKKSDLVGHASKGNKTIRRTSNVVHDTSTIIVFCPLHGDYSIGAQEFLSSDVAHCGCYRCKAAIMEKPKKR